ALLVREKLAWIGTESVNHAVPGNEAGFTVIGNGLDNTLSGNAAGAERLIGWDGNDTLIAVGNGDALDGGAGDDVLKSNNANHTSGTTYIGGVGNDTLIGNYYNDTYVFI